MNGILSGTDQDTWRRVKEMVVLVLGGPTEAYGPHYSSAA